MKFKKLLAAVTALVMSISVFGLSVFAEDEIFDLDMQVYSAIAKMSDEQLTDRDTDSTSEYTTNLDFSSINEIMDKMNTYGFAWYPNGNKALGYKENTLVLSNFNMSITSYPGYFSGIILPGNSTILYSGENEISNLSYFATTAVECNGDLTIKAAEDNASLVLLAYKLPNYNASRDEGSYISLFVKGNLTVDGNGFSETSVGVGAGGQNTSGSNCAIMSDGNITVAGDANLIGIQLSPYAATPAVTALKNIYIMEGALAISSKGYTFKGCVVTGTSYRLYAMTAQNVHSYYFKNGQSNGGIIYADTRGENVIFVTEATPVMKFVDRLYSTMLGRASEYEGRTDWVNKLNNGATATEVSNGFVLSEELALQNLTNTEFVSRMYRTFMNREPDEGGLADWTNALDSGCSYAFVLNSFVLSAEFGNICKEYGIETGRYEITEPRDVSRNLTAFTSRMYTKALGRAYEVNGLNYWTGRYINREISLNDMAYGFIFSEEFTNRNLSNEQYVDTLYATFFDRAPDAAGKADWLGQLNSGSATREQVLNGFLGAEEFVKLVDSFGL